MSWLSIHSAATEAITRFGGNIAKYLGEGVMAYFVWPEAAFAAPLSTKSASAAAVE
jgi:class 3 adenylate cyclase